MKETVYTILLLIILSLSIISGVYAVKVSGPNGEILAEYPGKIDGHRPFQVKITLNNSDVQKYANAIIADNNCYNFRILPDGVEFLPLDAEADKRWAQYVKYDHEKEVVLTLQSSRSSPLEYNGYEEFCTLRFFFLPTEESQKNPPILKNGRTLNEKTLLSEITIKPVRSNYSITMDLPEGVSKYQFSSSYNIFAYKYSTNNDGIGYNINAQLMRYGNDLDSDGMAKYTNSDWIFDPYDVDYRRHFAETTKINWFAGNLFDNDSEINKFDIGPFGKIMVEDAYYRTYSSIYDSQDYGRSDNKDMVQVKIMLHGQAFLKHAFVNFKMDKTVDTEKGNEDTVKNAAEQELISIMKSFMIKTEPIDEMTFVADNSKKDEEIIKDPVIVGTVADGLNNPMAYMKLKVLVGNEVFETYLKETGDFNITLTGKEIKEEEPLQVSIISSFVYKRDGKNYYTIYYRNPDDSLYYLVEITKMMNLTDKYTEAYMVLDGTWDPLITVSTGIKQWEQIKSLSVMYYHFHEAVDFSLEKLNANIDYKLPVEVMVGNVNKKTLYSPSNSEIYISLKDSSFSSSNRPKNREYHEFAHHIMYATYGAWPAGTLAPGVKNHDGFLNPNTGDSYLEGFAEFMAMAMAKEVGDPEPEIYASFGSQENNYKPWDAKGYDEEFAISSLLWDLYDSKNDKGDSISFMLEDIWKILKVNRKDFYEYYLAFRQAFSNKQEEIDALFVEHGFFANPDIGNKKRDTFEGFRDANNDKNFAEGEFFVDYGANNTTLLIYRESMKIGAAANYERMNRTSAVRIPNAYLKVTSDEVRWYIVKVDLKDNSLGEDYEYTVDVRDGLIYLQPLPSGYEADITVMPYSQDYNSEDPYKTTSAKLTEDIENATQGYIAVHDFKLKTTGKNLDHQYYLPEGVEPTYDYEGDIGDISGIELNRTDSEYSTNTKRGNDSLWIVAFIVVPLLIGIWYLTQSKKNKHK